MKLSDLIPAEFKTACPRATDATHGRLSVIRPGLPNAGKVLVEWGKTCPLFKANLEVARALKTDGKGNYNPNAGGWVFHRNVAAECHERFPQTLERTPEFLALVAAPDGQTHTPAGTDKPAPAAPRKHGRVLVNGNQFLVQWGGDAGFCPREAFDRYLTAARTIKADYPGCNGWNKPLNGWLLTRKAAATIARQFPGQFFDHPPELAADAAANPEPDNTPAPTNFAPNAATVALLAAADAVFATFAG